MRGDGKSKFYRTLNLDKESWNTLKEFNKLRKTMLKDLDKKKENAELNKED